MSLEQYVQLHEVIEIHYMVSHYEAQYYVQDGSKCLFEAEGKTIQEALDMLYELLKPFTLQQLRKMPGIKGKFANKFIRE